MASHNTLWVIDDDPALRIILEDAFSDAGLEVRVFANAKGAWATLNDVLHDHEPRSILPAVILTDIRMPMMDGLSFSEWVHQNFPELPIVIMTAHSDLKSAVDSYQTGAFDYLPKPFDLDDAVTVIKKAIAKSAVNTNDEDSAANTDTMQQSGIGSDSSSGSGNYSENESASDKGSNHTTTPGLNDSTLNANDDNAGTHNAASKKPSSPASNKATSIKSAPITSKPSKTKKSSPTKRNNKQASSTIASGIIGQSVAMQTVFRAIGRLSKSPITVLITGESGTGKELVAGALHQHSPRKDKAFIALNMAALPHDLIESELFGHEKGAFTGATTQRQGRFEQADGGTLFLDEIGDMPFSTQTRLLRVLADGEFFRVGGHKPIKVDVRIIAATHQNLEELVKQGKFREDLFYRLNVIRLPLPPLRDRRDDIPSLVDFFMARAADELNSEEKTLSTEAMQLMQDFNWSGNVRQLENACRWITVMTTGDLVTIDDLPPELTEFANSSQYISHSNVDVLDDLSYSKQAYSTQNQTPVSYQQADASNDSLEGSNRNEYVHQTSADVSNIHSSNSNTASTYFSNNDISDNIDLSWQEQLQAWADNALANGETEILQMATPEFEKVLINVAIKHSKGRKGEAAQLLGWGRNTLTRKIKQLELEVEN